MRACDNIMGKYHFEDAFPPMLGLYMCLFYLLNKLCCWFCISDVEDTKNRTLYMETKVLKIVVYANHMMPIKIMLLMYIL